MKTAYLRKNTKFNAVITESEVQKPKKDIRHIHFMLSHGTKGDSEK